MSIDSTSATSHSLPPGARSGNHLRQDGQRISCRHVERHRSSLRAGFHPYDANLRHAWATKGSAITGAVRMAPENVTPPAGAATVMVMLEQEEPTALSAWLSADGKTGKARLPNGDTLRISAICSNAGATVYGVRGEWHHAGMPDGSHRLLRGVVDKDRFTPHAYQPDLARILKSIPAWGLAGGAPSSIFDAIESNDLAELKQILQDTKSLNQTNDDGYSALHVAMQKSANDVVSLLLASERITFKAEDGAALAIVAARCDAHALRRVLNNATYTPFITQADYVAALHAVMSNPHDGLVTVEMVRLLTQRCTVADIDGNNRSALRSKIYEHFSDPDHIVTLEDALPPLLHAELAPAASSRKPRLRVSLSSLRKTQVDPQKIFDNFIVNREKALSADKLDTLQTWLGFPAKVDASQWIVFDHAKNTDHVAADEQASALARFVVALPDKEHATRFNGLTLLGAVLTKMGKRDVRHTGQVVTVLVTQLRTMPTQLQVHAISHCLTVPVLQALTSKVFAEVFARLGAQRNNASLDYATAEALERVLCDPRVVERANRYQTPENKTNQTTKNVAKNTAPNPTLLGADLVTGVHARSGSSSERSVSVGSHSRAASIVSNVTYSNIVTKDDLIQEAIRTQMNHIAGNYSDIPHLETYFKAVKDFASAKVTFLAGNHPGLSGAPAASVPLAPKAIGGAVARAPFVGAAANSAIGSLYQRLSNKRILAQRNLVPVHSSGKFSDTLARLLAERMIEHPERLRANGPMKKGVSRLEFFSASIQGTTSASTAAERFAQMVGEVDVERVFKHMAQMKYGELPLETKLAFSVCKLYQHEGIFLSLRSLMTSIADSWGELGQRSAGPLSEEPLMLTVTRDVKSNKAAIKGNTHALNAHEKAIATLTAGMVAMQGELRLLRELVGDRLPKVGDDDAEGRTRSGNLYRRTRWQQGTVSAGRTCTYVDGYAIEPPAGQSGVPILAFTLPEPGAGIYHQVAQGQLTGVAMANMLIMRHSGNKSSLLITEAGFSEFVKRLVALEEFADESSRTASIERRTRKMALPDLAQYFTAHANEGFPQIELHHGHFMPGPMPLHFASDSTLGEDNIDSIDNANEIDDFEEIGLDCAFRNAAEMVMIALHNARFHAYCPEKAPPLELDGATMSDALADFLDRHHRSNNPDGLAFTIVTLKPSDPPQQRQS